MFEVPEKRIFEYPDEWPEGTQKEINRLDRITENDSKVTEHYTDHRLGLVGSSKEDTHSQKKSLCIGGPLMGRRSTEALAKNYHVFNNAGAGNYRTVLVHDSLLEG